jgi:hypothetical protein
VPRLVATANTDGYSLGIAVKESYAWIADAAGGIKCFSLANPAHPLLVSELPAMGSAYAIAIDGDFAYVTCPHRGVQVVDITNPDAPRAVSEIGIPDVVATSPVIGDRIYVLGEAGRLAAYDITSPVQPVLIRESKIDGAPRSVAVTDGRAYLVDGDRQLDIVELHGSEGMKSVGSARLPHTAGFVGFGTGKLLVGSRRGALDTFELSDPIQSHHVGSFVPERVALRSASRDGVWYRPSYQMGIQISPGRNSGHELPENSNGWYATGGSAVCVAIDGHYAYVANGDAGLLVLDVTDPVAPLPSGEYDVDGYVTDVKLVDQYAFVAAGRAGLVVFDKSDPKALQTVGAWKEARAATSLAMQDGIAYVNSVDDLHALEVSDPSNPVLLGTHEIQAESALLRAKGEFVHVLSGEQGTTVVHCRRSSEAQTANTPQQPVATGRNGSSPNPETLTRDSSASFDVFLARATAGDNEALSRVVTLCMDRRLSEVETRLTMNAALTKQVQMPASRSLSTWLNLLDNMHEEDALTAEESRRYFQNMTLMAMAVRPQIRQGDPLPVRFERHQRGGWRFDMATKNLCVSVDKRRIPDGARFSAENERGVHRRIEPVSRGRNRRSCLNWFGQAHRHDATVDGNPLHTMFPNVYRVAQVSEVSVWQRRPLLRRANVLRRIRDSAGKRAIDRQRAIKPRGAPLDAGVDGVRIASCSRCRFDEAGLCGCPAVLSAVRGEPLDGGAPDRCVRPVRAHR